MNNNAIAAGLYTWLLKYHPTILVRYHEEMMSAHEKLMGKAMEGWDEAVLIDEDSDSVINFDELDPEAQALIEAIVLADDGLVDPTPSAPAPGGTEKPSSSAPAAVEGDQ